MINYNKFIDRCGYVISIILSALYVPFFLYRLFNVILTKNKNKGHLFYLILTVIPIISTILFVLDIVKSATHKHPPKTLGELFTKNYKDGSNNNTNHNDKDVIDVEAEVVE